MKNAKRMLSAFLCVLMLFCCLSCSAYAAENERTDFGLRFKNGSFTVMQLADIQDHYPIAERSLETIRLAVEKYKPDLIVLTGDNIVDSLGLSSFRSAVSQLVTAFGGTPFAATFGNHDSEAYDGASRETQYAEYVAAGALDFDNNFSDSDLGGVGTGVIPIRSSDGSSVAFNIVLFDSGTYSKNGGYGKVGFSDNAPYNDEAAYGAVVDWFRDLNGSMRQYSADSDYVPTLCFQHIPIREFYTSGIIVQTSDGSGLRGYSATIFANKSYIPNPDNPTITGEYNEVCCCSTDDTSAMYKALAENGNVKGIFYGHDHTNSIVGLGTVNYDGIDYSLVQGYCKSCTTYAYNDGDTYVRIFSIDESGEYTSLMDSRSSMLGAAPDEDEDLYESGIFAGALRSLIEFVRSIFAKIGDITAFFESLLRSVFER